jgi:hypothetical protein
VGVCCRNSALAHAQPDAAGVCWTQLALNLPPAFFDVCAHDDLYSIWHVGLTTQTNLPAGHTALVSSRADVQRGFKSSHRNVRKSWDLPQSFPRPEVLKAYAEPMVDRNKRSFTWGRPDLELLRIFCRWIVGRMGPTNPGVQMQRH